MSEEKNRVFNFIRLEEVTGGDSEFEQELLEEFLSDTPDALRRLVQAIEIQDYQAVQMESHALKGSSLSLGADNLGEVASKLEDISREGHVEGAAGLAHELEGEFEKVSDAIRDRLQRAA